MPEGRQLPQTSLERALGWMRFGTASASRPADRSEPPGAGGLAAIAREGRRELLEAICTFLIDNDLSIDPANLTAAWTAFSGASPSLLRRIHAQSQAGDRVTQRWLNEVTAGSASQQQEQETLRKAMEDLDQSIDRYSRDTSAARSATSEYHAQLDRHVLQLEELGQEADMVCRLASLARSMAQRTREAEDELKVREQEAKALRRRLDKARRESVIDHLTGLPNRRAFEVELERQYAEAAAAGDLLTIAFCDVDHFKRVNDQHGHDAGDRVLKLIAKLLAQTSGDEGHVSRHGGEEFVLLFRGLASAQAKERLDAAREDLSERRLLNRKTEEPFGRITFSAGVADVFAHADPCAALKAADGALYRAKQAGRNLVFVA